MKLNTRMLGEVDIQEEDRIVFHQGLPGFESLKEYVLLKTEDDIPFSFLQSTEDEQVSFIVTNPFWFYKEYEFQLSTSAKEALLLADPHDLTIWSIVSIPDALENATLNLQAPVLINTRERLGAQVILHDTGYHPKHPLIRQETSHSEAGGR